MINVLVVEDEYIEREALAKLIREQFKDEVDIVIACNNGESALTEFEEREFQLVITDINVPKLSGLELLTKIKARSHKTRMIVVTGYDYFKYAQEAIRIGVDDFLLKPATHKEICQRIRKVLEQMGSTHHDHLFSESSKYQEMQTILKSELIYAILYNDTKSHIERYFRVFHMIVSSAFCFCVKREDGVNEAMKKLAAYIEQYDGYYCIYKTYFDHIACFVFCEHVMDYGDILHIENMLKETKKTIVYGMGNIKEDVDTFYHSFVEALVDIKGIENKENIKDANELNASEWIKAFIEEILENLQNGRISTIPDLSQRLYYYIVTQEHNSERLFHLFFEQMEERLKKDGMEEVYLIKLRNQSQAILKMLDISDVRIYMNYILKGLSDSMAQSRKSLNKHIDLALQYIENNYYRPIGLQDLAQHLDVTPQYISSLLSQYTHRNFTNILAECRIQKAKELMEQDKKIKEIASLVGFQNQNYFAKTFKKVTGLSPKEYINLHMNT